MQGFAHSVAWYRGMNLPSCCRGGSSRQVSVSECSVEWEKVGHRYEFAQRDCFLRAYTAREDNILPYSRLWVFWSALPYFVLPTAGKNPDRGGISRIFRYFPGMIRGKEGKTVTVPSRRKKTEKFQKNLIFPLAVFGKKGYSHTARNIRVIFQKKGVRS